MNAPDIRLALDTEHRVAPAQQGPPAVIPPFHISRKTIYRHIEPTTATPPPRA